MKIKEVHEGAEPKLPGAPGGISIMTPQQFVAKADDMPEEDVAEGKPGLWANIHAKRERIKHGSGERMRTPGSKGAPTSDALKKSATEGVAEGSEQVYKVVAVNKSNALKKPTKLTVKAGSIEEVFERLAVNDWYPLEIDGVEVINGKRLKQGVAEGSIGKDPKAKDLGMFAYYAITAKQKDEPSNPYPAGTQSSTDFDKGYGTAFLDQHSFKIDASVDYLAMNYNVRDRLHLLGKQQGVAEDLKMLPRQGNETNAERQKRLSDQLEHEYKTRTGQFADYNDNRYPSLNDYNTHGDDEYQAKKLKKQQGVAEGYEPGDKITWYHSNHHPEIEGTVVGRKDGHLIVKSIDPQPRNTEKTVATYRVPKNNILSHNKQDVAEGQEHLNRIRSLSGLGEATKLPAQTRDLGGQEFQDYMKRIVGSPDLDKAGNVKVDKKGNEKYTTGKTKSDRFKLPYIHRSSVVEYLGPDGRTYDEDKIKQTLSIRPKALLKQNEKMKHSNGEFEQFFNIGFAALTGIALDQTTNNLIVVNTCPGAGSCKVDCFAMKGGKIQFKNAWQSDGRILTYLLNDPDGFFNQLSNEISVESQAAAKGDKKFPNGWQVTVRWHDAGDFFSPEYLDMALKMAAKHPDVRFYAYTKMAGAALAQKPDNFIINWSEGANTTQEKQVKAQDPKLDTTKNSRIVPEKLFYDLLAKDEKGNLKKTADGAWQPASPQALADMKQRIAKEYGISASSILSYTEYMAKRNAIPAGMKYNVIVAPGEGDVSANDPGVLSTLLLRH